MRRLGQQVMRHGVDGAQKKRSSAIQLTNLSCKQVARCQSWTFLDLLLHRLDLSRPGVKVSGPCTVCGLCARAVQRHLKDGQNMMAQASAHDLVRSSLKKGWQKIKASRAFSISNALFSLSAGSHRKKAWTPNCKSALLRTPWDNLFSPAAAMLQVRLVLWAKKLGRMGRCDGQSKTEVELHCSNVQHWMCKHCGNHG